MNHLEFAVIKTDESRALVDKVLKTWIDENIPGYDLEDLSCEFWFVSHVDQTIFEMYPIDKGLDLTKEEIESRIVTYFNKWFAEAKEWVGKHDKEELSKLHGLDYIFANYLMNHKN